MNSEDIRRMMTTQIKRRDFIKTTLSAGVLTGFPSIIPASALGKGGKAAPSERVNLALISCGNRSAASLEYRTHPKAQVIAVCDPIRDRRLKRSGEFDGCPDFNDFRDVLAIDDVDAVHISTGDQWHVPISLAAARAGKDMYTEKPLGISIEEDLVAREIVEKHNRIFQYGTQNRSMIQLRMGIEMVLNGHIGDVEEIYVWAPPGESGGTFVPSSVPTGIDYDMWLGPAKLTPYCNDRVLVQGPRNGIFHIYDYAIGFIAGWGAHPVDQLQWWADEVNLGIPVEYNGKGTIPTEGLFDTITHWDVDCSYANGLKMRFLDNKTARSVGDIPHIDKIKFNHCALFIGSQGWVAVSRGAWQVYPDKLLKIAKNPGPKKVIHSNNHQHNFVDAVLERKQPISNLESAIQSDLICHLSNISIRTGRPIRWDPNKTTIVGDTAALAMMSRPMRDPWTL